MKKQRVCGVCGEAMPGGPEAEMYDPSEEPGQRVFCHAECGRQAGLEVA
jgi:hypothetical protein